MEMIFADSIRVTDKYTALVFIEVKKRSKKVEVKKK